MNENKQRLQKLAGIKEALPVPTSDNNAMMAELSLLLQYISDIDIDKALQLDPNTQKKLAKMAGELNRFLRKQSKILGR